MDKILHCLLVQPATSVTRANIGRIALIFVLLTKYKNHA